MTETARERLERLRAKYSAPEQSTNAADQSTLAGTLRSAAQGLTFGFSDEISAFLQSRLGGDYEKILDEERKKLASFRESNPALAYGAEIGAGMLIPGGWLKAGKTAITAGKAAATGAVGGGLYGAGASEQEGASRLVDAGIGATAGAVISPLANKVIGGVSKRIVRGRDTDKIRSAAESQILAKAGKDLKQQSPELAAELQQRGLAPTEALRQQINGDTTLMDVAGNRLQRYGRGLVRASDDASAKALEVAESRTANEYSRVINDAVRLANAGLDSNDLVASVKAVSKQASQPLYQDAYKMTQLPMKDFRDVIMSSEDLFKQAYEKYANIVKNKGAAAVARGEITPQEAASRLMPDFDDFLKQETVSTQILHNIKMGLDEVVYGIKKDPSSSIGKKGLNSIRDVLAGFNDLIIKKNPYYGRANKIFAVGEAVEDAAEEGAKFLKTQSNTALRKTYSKLSTESEKEAFRTAALEQIKIRARNENSSIAAKIADDRELRDRIKILFPSETRYKEFLATLGREKNYRKTNRMISGGSDTAQNQIDIAAAMGVTPETLPGTVAGAAFSPAFEAGRIGGNLGSKLRSLKNRKIAAEAGNILFTKSPEEAQQALNRLRDRYPMLSDQDSQILRSILAGISSVGAPTGGLLVPSNN